MSLNQGKQGLQTGTTDDILKELGLGCLIHEESYRDARATAIKLVDDAKKARADLLKQLQTIEAGDEQEKGEGAQEGETDEKEKGEGAQEGETDEKEKGEGAQEGEKDEQEKGGKGNRVTSPIRFYYSDHHNILSRGGAYENGYGAAWNKMQKYLGQNVTIALTNGSFSENHDRYYPITSEIVISFIVESDWRNDPHNVQLKRFMGMLDQYWFHPAALVILIAHATRILDDMQWEYVQTPVTQLLDALEEILFSVAWNNIVQGREPGYENRDFNAMKVTKVQEWCARYIMQNGLYLDNLLWTIDKNILELEQEEQDIEDLRREQRERPERERARKENEEEQKRRDEEEERKEREEQERGEKEDKEKRKKEEKIRKEEENKRQREEIEEKAKKDREERLKKKREETEKDRQKKKEKEEREQEKKQKEQKKLQDEGKMQGKYDNDEEKGYKWGMQGKKKGGEEEEEEEEEEEGSEEKKNKKKKKKKGPQEGRKYKNTEIQEMNEEEWEELLDELKKRKQKLQFVRVKFRGYIKKRDESTHKFRGIHKTVQRHNRNRNFRGGMGTDLDREDEDLEEMPVMVWDQTNKNKVHKSKTVMNGAICESGLYIPNTGHKKTTKIYQTQTEINEWALNSDDYLFQYSHLYDQRMIHMKDLYFDNADPHKNIRPCSYVTEICLANARESTYNEGSKMLSIQHKLSPKDSRYALATIVVADPEYEDEKWVHVASLSLGSEYNETHFLCSFIELAKQTLCDQHPNNPFLEDKPHNEDIQMVEYDSLRISKSLYFYWGILEYGMNRVQVGMSVESLRHLEKNADVIHVTKKLCLPGLVPSQEMNEGRTLDRWVTSMFDNIENAFNRTMALNHIAGVNHFAVGKNCVIPDVDTLYYLIMKIWWSEGEGKGKGKGMTDKDMLDEMKKMEDLIEKEKLLERISLVRYFKFLFRTLNPKVGGTKIEPPKDIRKRGWIYRAIVQQRNMDAQEISQGIDRWLKVEYMVDKAYLLGKTSTEIKRIKDWKKEMEDREKYLREVGDVPVVKAVPDGKKEESDGKKGESGGKKAMPDNWEEVPDEKKEDAPDEKKEVPDNVPDEKKEAPIVKPLDEWEIAIIWKYELKRFEGMYSSKDDMIKDAENEILKGKEKRLRKDYKPDHLTNFDKDRINRKKQKENGGGGDDDPKDETPQPESYSGKGPRARRRVRKGLKI
jgi:hypothetical protein